jgi:hypothetical protein
MPPGNLEQLKGRVNAKLVNPGGDVSFAVFYLMDGKLHEGEFGQKGGQPQPFPMALDYSG